MEGPCAVRLIIKLPWHALAQLLPWCGCLQMIQHCHLSGYHPNEHIPPQTTPVGLPVLQTGNWGPEFQDLQGISLLAPIEVQSNQASKRGSNTGEFHLGGFALGGQFQLIRAWKTGPHILSDCLNTGILPPLPCEQTWVWAKPAWVKVSGCHPLCCHVKARWWDCLRISQGISAAG